jgi:hypothetical protein
MNWHPRPSNDRGGSSVLHQEAGFRPTGTFVGAKSIRSILRPVGRAPLLWTPLLPRRVRSDLAAVVVTRAAVFPPRQRGRRPHSVNGLHPGSLHATACALTAVSARRGARCFGLPLAPPSSYPGALLIPGAGPPPASSRVSTAYCAAPFCERTRRRTRSESAATRARNALDQEGSLNQGQQTA